MMARDSADAPPPQPLSPEVVERLRTAVRDLADRNDLEPTDALRQVLQQVASEARAKAMRAEDLVIAFKAILDALPRAETAAARLRQGQLRERLISLCIKAFYAS
jgi:hypothetical protein